MDNEITTAEVQEHSQIVMIGSLVAGAIAGFYATGLGQKAFLAAATLIKDRKNQEVEED